MQRPDVKITFHIYFHKDIKLSSQFDLPLRFCKDVKVCEADFNDKLRNHMKFDILKSEKF